MNNTAITKYILSISQQCQNVPLMHRIVTIGLQKIASFTRLGNNIEKQHPSYDYSDCTPGLSNQLGTCQTRNYSKVLKCLDDK